MLILQTPNRSTKFNRFFFIIFIALLSIGCARNATSQNSSATPLYTQESFKKYWYSGLAEISSYQLEQSRYGESRNGKAVLIFVTEDFSQKKQVKLDRPDVAGADKVGVLKVNFTKNFVTGIYPYSTMVSSFTPIEGSTYPRTLKATMTSQEWCGQVFAQLNLNGNEYALHSFSYFEQEGDQTQTYQAVLLEDELFNRIRLSPETLPVGSVKILPGLLFSRLLHVPLSVQTVTISKKKERDQFIYSVFFPAHQRTLTIRFQAKFPHQILGWQEQFKERGKTVITNATLDKTLRVDYWTKNKQAHILLRDSLGLSPTNY